MATELKVSGMDCTNCALGIRRSLNNAGFTNVDVEFTSGRVSFEEIESRRIRTAVAIIRNLGYQVEGELDSKQSFLGRLENRLAISALLTLPLLAHMVLPWHFLHSPWVQLALATPVYLIGMVFFGRSAFNSLKAGVANMDVLVTLGASAAFFYSLYGTLAGLGPDYQFYESAATIITVIMLGNLLERKAVKQTGSHVDELEKLQGETARRIEKTTEKVEEVKVSDLSKGDWVLINQGEPVPADGLVLFGKGAADESLMTGESMPVPKGSGDKLMGGSLLVQGTLKMEITALGAETLLSGIINLVRKAQKDKPKLQNLADRISAVFVPAVVVIALFTFLISYFLLDSTLQASMLRSVAVLVVACPCALGLAIPTAVMVGIGLAAKNGIMIKKASLFDILARVRNLVFDKTGTLSTGKFRVNDLQLDGIEEHEAFRIIYNLEKHSNHPVARSLVEFTGRRAPIAFREIKETPGVGIESRDDEAQVYWLGRDDQYAGDSGIDLVLKINDQVRAHLVLSDDLRPDAASAVASLRTMGLEVAMLSGDKASKVKQVASALGVSTSFAGKSPQEKLGIIGDMSLNAPTAMVGDGINDAPALGRAGVGISFGSAAAISMNAAEVVILDHKLSSVPLLIRLSRMTQTTIRQNLFWAFFYNVLMIPIAAAGFLNPMMAAIAMALSDVIVVLNSLRLRRRFRRSASSLLHTA